MSFRQSGQSRVALSYGVRNAHARFRLSCADGRTDEGLVEAEYDQADARYLGAEARVDLALRRDLWLNLGFDAVDAQTHRHAARRCLGSHRYGERSASIGIGPGLRMRPELILSNRQWQVFPNGDTYGRVRSHQSHGELHDRNAARCPLFGVNFFNVGDSPLS